MDFPGPSGKVADLCAPQLLERHGVGPDTAAALCITAGGNPDRLASQATGRTGATRPLTGWPEPTRQQEPDRDSIASE